MLANNGRRTKLTMIAAHVAYGSNVGELAARAS
jgi:hypothetical protein